MAANQATSEKATSPLGRPADNLPRAVAYMVLVAIFIPMLNATAKYLAEQQYPVIEIVWWRYAGHFAVMVLVFAPRLGARLLVASRPMLQMVRSSLLAAATLIFMSALAYVPLTTATAMSFTGPFIVTALAPLLLGERVGLVRWLFVIFGFLGALIILRPGLGVVEPAAFLLLGSAFTSALYQIMSRKLASHDRAETSITYIALAGFALSTPAMPFVWVTPASALHWVLFVALGVFGGFGHYFWQRALEIAPAPFVSPFSYLGLIGAALLSVVVFGTFPDIFVWIGAFIIAGSGILMLYYEHRQRARGRL